MGFIDKVKSKIGLSERKAHVLSDPAILEMFGGRSTVSGVNVGGISALYIPAVLQAVRLISESVGSLPVKLFREGGDSKETARDHTAFKIVHRRANEWTGATTLRTDLTADALIYGNGFARVVRYDDGRPFELIRLLPGTVSVIEDTLAALPPTYRVSENGGSRDYSHTEILHIPSFLKRSPVSFGREALGLAAILERDAAQLFGSNRTPRGIIEDPEKVGENTSGAARVVNVLKSWRKWQDTGGRDPLYLDGGKKFSSQTMTSTDPNFLSIGLNRSGKWPVSLAFRRQCSSNSHAAHGQTPNRWVRNSFSFAFGLGWIRGPKRSQPSFSPKTNAIPISLNSSPMTSCAPMLPVARQTRWPLLRRVS